MTMEAFRFLCVAICVSLTLGYDPFCKRCQTCMEEQNYTVDSPFVDGKEGKCRYNELKTVAFELDALYTKVKAQTSILEDLLGEINLHIAEGKFYTNDWRRVKKCTSGAAFGGSLRPRAFRGTSHSPNANPSYGRLNAPVKPDSIGAWVMSKPYSTDQSEYLQIDIGEVRTVTGVATQGQPGGNAWVTTYSVYYSTSGDDNYWFTRVYDEHWDDKVFEGNTDDSTMVIGNFHVFSQARYIRIYPLSYHNAPALRVDVLTC